MKMKKKFFTAIIGLTTIGALLMPIKANAALQANGNASIQNTIAYWIENVRKMEEAGGTLGLTDKINTTIDENTNTYLTSVSSNNLDIHMQKNSEYGAMAILSASAYGNQNVIGDGETTTGNKSGVYMKLNKEWVSAGTISELPNYLHANAKYKDIYTTTQTSKPGDALLETYRPDGYNWHNGISSSWFALDSHSGLIRGYAGSIFSYYGHCYYHINR